MALTLNAACGSFIGNGRNRNEDNFYFGEKHLPVENRGLKQVLKSSVQTEEPVLVAVFDGMGGECQGEEAACLASETFGHAYKCLEELALSGKEFFCKACEQSNIAVNRLRESRQLKAMGTTVAAVYFSQNETVSCNIGDSKIFRIRNKKMVQISKDHTDERIMTAMGVHKKPVLLQYIGMPETEMIIEPYILKGELWPEDVYVLCTDGVTDVLKAEEIYEIIGQNSAEEAVRKILAAVCEKNGEDNATVIVIKTV